MEDFEQYIGKTEFAILRIDPSRLSKEGLIKNFSGLRFEVAQGHYKVCNFRRQDRKDVIVAAIKMWQLSCIASVRWHWEQERLKGTQKSPF